MAFDTKEMLHNALRAPAENAVQNSTEIAPEIAPVTPEELEEVVATAEKSIAQSSELAALKGEDTYNINEFKEVTSMHDIMLEKLNEFTENKDFVVKAMETLGDKLEAINRIALTREQREMQADLIVGLLKTDREQKAYAEEVKTVTRDALLTRRFGEYGAKSLKDSYISDVKAKFGEKTAEKLMRSMTPDEFVNAVIAYDTAQRSEYLEFKKTGSLPRQTRTNDNFMRNNPDVVKSYEQKKQAEALQAEIDSYYSSINNLNRR